MKIILVIVYLVAGILLCFPAYRDLPKFRRSLPAQMTGVVIAPALFPFLLIWLLGKKTFVKIRGSK